MRVLVAPDKFRGTLDAFDAAAAIAAGWRRGDPSATVETLPLADGGEGTLDVLLEALDGERRSAAVTGPLGDLGVAEFGWVAGAEDGPLAVIEMARASGLALIPQPDLDPMRASTRGTGELILAACRAGARRVIIGVGGSATNDGGAGAVQALGVRLLAGRDREVRPGGAALLGLEAIEVSGLDPVVRGAAFVVATDVDNPLTGPAGASSVYGPQKGATPADVDLLDRALRRFAEVIRRDLGVEVEGVPGAGAAGGLAAGLVAFLGAGIRPGIEVVMQAAGFPERLAAADLVVTGEGSFDAQSARGKTVAGVLRAAHAAGVPVVVLCGRATEGAPAEGPTVRVASLVVRYGEAAAMERAGASLEDLASETARVVAREKGA